MAKLTLPLIRAIKECSMDASNLTAFIQSVDMKPEPIEELMMVAPAKKRGRPRKYETRDMTVGA